MRSSRYEARGKFVEYERSQVLHISMNAQLMYEAIVLKHFQPDGLNVVKGLLLPPSRFSALIILFQENISLRCKRSCLRLVKKLTGEFMRVNELYFLIEYKIILPKRKTKMLFHWLTSWACTIGIWSTLTQLNLNRQSYYLCHKRS